MRGNNINIHFSFLKSRKYFYTSNVYDTFSCGLTELFTSVVPTIINNLQVKLTPEMDGIQVAEHMVMKLKNSKEFLTAKM